MNRLTLVRSHICGMLIASAWISCVAGLPQSPPVTTDESVQLIAMLHEPMPRDEDIAGRDALAKRKARAAAQLVKLGRADLVWPLLRQSYDNSCRTYLIRELAVVDPAILIRR